MPINFGLDSSERTIELSSQLPTVNVPVLIEGGGITVSGGSARVFQVGREGALDLLGLTVIDGAAGAGGSGGGIYNGGSSPLGVNYSTFSGNSASGNGIGGAVFNEEAAGAATCCWARMGSEGTTP
jgi:hypothetical protein